MDQSRIAVVLVGVGCGVATTLLVILLVYCIRRRLISRGLIRDPHEFKISNEEHRLYRQRVHKSRMKRYSHQRQLRRELAVIPRTQNPLVYNAREVDLAVPGPAAKNDTSVATPVDATA